MQIDRGRFIYGRSLEATAVGSSLASLQSLFPASAKPR